MTSRSGEDWRRKTRTPLVAIGLTSASALAYYIDDRYNDHG
jgi:hypothetical protein